ncbi:MAG: NFACT family protein [Candidatus Micrarchaeota archaeon]|nr:NFACT family protein [Candidatus Micrarchaeota archaeon]
MARTMSNWEYRAMLQDAQPLCGQRLEKAYELSRNLFRLDFGKRSLIVSLGAYFYLCDNPPPGPAQPTSIAMQLRKHLEGQRLAWLTAYKSDRLYVFEFSSGWKILLEQYAGGNLFLLDDKGLIVRPYHYRPTAARVYNTGTAYAYPDSPDFPFPPGIEQWRELARSSPDEKLEKALARWPIGRLYTNEAIAQSGLDGQAQVGAIREPQAGRLLDSLKSVLSHPAPLVYEKANLPGRPVELSLAPLSAYSGPEFAARPFASWSEAVEYFFARAAAPAEKKESPEVLKLRHRLLEQQSALERLEKEIAAFEPSARWLEGHLAEVEARLHELETAGPAAKARAGEKIDWKNKKLKIDAKG